MRIQTNKSRGLPLLVSLILFATPTVFALTAADEKLAAQLVAVTRVIDVGQSRQSEVEQKLLPFARFASSDTTTVNGAILPRVSFHFDNEISRRTTKTPYTTLDLSITYEKGLVVEKTLRLYVASGYAAAVLQRKRGFGFKDAIVHSEDLSRYVGHNWQSATHMGRIDVTDDSGLALAIRQADWNINVGCLIKPGGCKDAREMIYINKHDLVDSK